MRQHRATVLGVLVATFLVGVILWSLLTPSTDARLAALRQKGIPVTLAELDAWYAPVTNGENAALIYTHAFSLPLFADSANPSVLFDDKSWLPPRGQALADGEKKELSALLADNQEAVRLVHSVPAGSRSRYPLDLKQGCRVPLPHLSKIKRTVHLLSNEAILAASTGQNQAAVLALAAAGQAAESLAEEPLMMSQLVRSACWRIVLTRLERVLSLTSLTEKQLAMLAGTLAKAEQPQGLLRALVGEQACGLAVFVDPTTAAFSSGNPKGSERFGLLAIISLLKTTGLLQRDRAFYLDCMRTHLAIAEAPFPERARRGQQVAANGFRPPNRYYIFSSMLLAALSNCTVRDSEHVGRIRAAQTALAVERFRLAHAGALPADLQQLVPQYLSGVPADPFDGQPLRFKKLAVGYVIYSIGDDNQDDGGLEVDPKKSSAPHDVTFFVER